ncbi:MAG: hypothetical protein KDC26_01820 [Armatimonadetes bacterium]|nr:hypothetical protein [Armatimonadota bacterium]
MRKVLIPVLALSLAAGANAQLAAARAMMAPALSDLGYTDQYSIVISGNENDGSTLTNLWARVSFMRTTAGVPYLEFLTYRNTTLLNRVVADGTFLWNYDAEKNSYWSWAYTQVPTGQTPEQAILMMFKRAVPGSYGVLTQTMVEANEVRRIGTGSMQSRWRPWQPLSNVLTSSTQIIANANTPRVSQTTYNISTPVPGTTRITAIDFNENGSGVKSGYYTQWSATFQHGTLVPSTDFTFTPPAGSRATAIQLASGG